VRMSQISGQDRQPALGVFAGSIPTQQCLDRETVPKVMKARAMTRIRSA
jgi:hypothetical protein